MAKNIIDLFPQHKTYCEVFGGAAHVLFRKKPSPVEVYNDIDSVLTLFFSILRDEDMANQLRIKLELTPYSRDEFNYCLNNWRDETDNIEKIRQWYVALMQCYSKSLGNTAWSYSKSVSRRNMSQCVSQWLSKIEKKLPLAVERLKTVQIENLHFRDCIKKYDTIGTLFYLDPPYIHSTRKMTYAYENEMSVDEHRELVQILQNIKGKAVLSGYDNDIYNGLEEAGWSKICIGEFDKKSMRHSVDTERGKEFVWINYEI